MGQKKVVQVMVHSCRSWYECSEDSQYILWIQLEPKLRSL